MSASFKCALWDHACFALVPGLIDLVEETPGNAGDIRDKGSVAGSGRSPGRRKWQPAPVLLPGESHGQRSLVRNREEGEHENVAADRRQERQMGRNTDCCNNRHGETSVKVF